MPRIFIKMNGVDPMVFVTGVFDKNSSLASNSLVPIIVEQELFDDFQTLQFALDASKQISSGSFWFSILGPLSLGQFAARFGAGLFAFARSDIVFRKPTPGEIREDLLDFGEQVIGPEYTGQEIGEAQVIMTYGEKEYFYRGPLRPLRATLTARILAREDVPSDYELEGCKSEVDADCGTPECSTFQSYITFLTNGAGRNFSRMMVYRFRDISEFSSEKMQLLGTIQVEEKNQKLFFLPGGIMADKVDFSINFWEG